MCILFLYLNAHPEQGTFKIIIASNRDESLTRPTQPAHVWGIHDDIISPMDRQVGAGGTWIGVSKSGKIGALLNVMSPNVDANARGRGHLVADYLQSDVSGEVYMSNLKTGQYNPFHMVSVDVTRKDLHAARFTHGENEDDGPHSVSNGLHSFCNAASYNTPFRKCGYGLQKFEQAIKQFNKVSENDKLQEALLEIMDDSTSLFPDPLVTEQNNKYPTELYEKYCAIAVKAWKFNYGTRTHTLITVDDNNNVEYLEKTMQEPINNPNDPNWITTKFQVSINS